MMPKSARKHKYESDTDLPKQMKALQLGAWRIIYVEDGVFAAGLSYFNLFDQDMRLSKWKQSIKNSETKRYFVDVFRIAPTLVIVYTVAHLLAAAQDALELQCSNLFLNAIEASFVSGQSNIRQISGALLLRALAVALIACCRWITNRVRPLLKEHIRTYFKGRIMEAHLRLDLLSSQEKSKVIDTNLAWTASGAVDGMLELLTTITSTFSQFLVVVHILRKQEGGIILALLCMLHPLFSIVTVHTIWNKNAFFYVNDTWRLRVMALYQIATSDDYRQEVLSGGMGKYLKREYEDASIHAKLLYDDFPPLAYDFRDTPFVDIAGRWIEDIPLVYFAYRSLANPKGFSVASLAILTQTTQAVKHAITRLSSYGTSTTEITTGLKQLYAGLDSSNDFRRGTLAYPSLKTCQLEGMHIEFRNVTFQYPGTQEEKMQAALRAVSFRLPSSSLIVIVGENGSGKTSLAKLLAGLYIPTSGTILVDGTDVHLYNASDLANATTLLTQEHSIFPLNVAENIGIGDPEAADNMQSIRQAAGLGGSEGFIEKLSEGYDEVLHPVVTAGSLRYMPSSSPELQNIMDEVERQTDISGGEKQRLAASRMFMRLTSGRTKLVIVDEPTSAMDPAGEYELFQNLRSLRAGKTMVFVTHRFGHLTKHADLILCMKGGALVESGTHPELIAISGEYKRLYNIQARAFVDGPVE